MSLNLYAVVLLSIVITYFLILHVPWHFVFAVLAVEAADTSSDLYYLLVADIFYWSTYI